MFGDGFPGALVIAGNRTSSRSPSFSITAPPSGIGEPQRAVDTSGGRLNQVGIRETILVQSEHEVPSGLHELRPFAVDMGVRCRRLGSRVNNCLRFVDLGEFVNKRPICQIPLTNGRL